MKISLNRFKKNKRHIDISLKYLTSPCYIDSILL